MRLIDHREIRAASAPLSMALGFVRRLCNLAYIHGFLRNNESLSSSPELFPVHFKSTVSHAHDSVPEQSDPIAEILSTEYRFSPKEIAQLQPKLSKLQKLLSVERCREVVELLRRFGFTDDHIRKTLIKYPLVLCFTADERLKPRLEVLRSFGLREKGLGDAVSRAPRLLHSRNLVRNIEEFQQLFGRKINLIRIVQKVPSVLSWNSEKVTARFETLKQLGFQQDYLLKLVSKNPTLLRVPPAETSFIMDYLKSLGISESSRTFATACSCIVRGGKDLDKRVEVLAKAGLKDNEIKKIFRRHPYAIAKSPEKLQSVMDYLVKSADLSPRVVITYPSIFGYSLERRIIPRHEAFKVLNATGPSIRRRSLGAFIKLTERQFLKYVMKTPYASEILKIYKAASEGS